MSGPASPSGSVVRPSPRFSRPYSPAYRPTLVDYLCMLIGFTVSLALAKWSDIQAKATQATPEGVQVQLLPLLPVLLLLPVGILLFWPWFFFTQWLRGRRE